jgi:uncharacterized protein (DUF433 family)
MDVVAILGALAEQGVTALLKEDFVRIDAATVEDCLAYAVPRLRSLGLTVPG